MSNFSNNLFIHLRVHSAYSLSFGALQIDKIIDLAKNDNQPAICITDNNNMFGALEFSENISSVGTQPIIGTQVQFRFKNTYGLIPLIAKNYVGYKNIIELSSKAYLENVDNDQPHCSIEDLTKYSDGIIVLSGAINNLIGNMFNKNIPTKKQTGGKVDKMTRKSINTSAKELGIQGPTTLKQSVEPEGETI